MVNVTLSRLCAWLPGYFMGDSQSESPLIKWCYELVFMVCPSSSLAGLIYIQVGHTGLIKSQISTRTWTPHVFLVTRSTHSRIHNHGYLVYNRQFQFVFVHRPSISP